MRRVLGRSGIEVSALGMGTWAIGGAMNGPTGRPLGWGEVDDAVSIRAIQTAIDLGVTLFDTADVYGIGHAETVLGAALGPARDKVVIATKWGIGYDEQRGHLLPGDGSPGYARVALAASLRRLRTDYVDVYQLHLNELNVFSDAAASEMVALCEAHDLASLNRSPLAMGLLTEKVTADSRFAPDTVRGTAPAWLTWFAGGRPVPAFLERRDAVRDVLTSGGRTIAQGALAWVWARSGRTIPLPGCRTPAQAAENAAALTHGPLRPDQMTQIEQIMSDHP